MFIKTSRANGYEYIKLVESYRDENNVTRHNVLFNFGRADQIKNTKSFINIAKRLCEIAGIGITESTPKLDCSEAQMLKYGYLPYLSLWEKLGIGNSLRKMQTKTRCKFSLIDATFLMAAQHLLMPKSKLATCGYQENYLGLHETKLHHLYRTLEKLAEHKEAIEGDLFKENYIKVGHKVDVVFYDVTTSAFESVIADELKNFGFSKDCKFKEVQVVMGLLIDSNGLPIGYELFPGNTFDGKTMVAALGNIQKRFGINKVIIVADRGLNSKGNLTAIKEAGYGYIVASKIKGLKKQVKEQIFDGAGYVSVSDEFRYKTIDYMNCFKDENGRLHNLHETLVVSFSQKRANKDRQDRQRLIDKANKMLCNPSSIKSAGKRGGKKYIVTNNSKTETYSLDENRIELDSSYDGYYGIQSSEKEMPASEIIDAYHTLWRIEESFRVMKSTLEARPVFHWTPQRIHGHFVVCFLAFMLERKLEMLLNEQGVDNSPGRIKEALNSMQLAKVMINDETLYIKARNQPLANHICRLLKLKQPKNINTEEELKNIFEIEQKTLWGQICLF
jgi:transposase